MLYKTTKGPKLNSKNVASFNGVIVVGQPRDFKSITGSGLLGFLPKSFLEDILIFPKRAGFKYSAGKQITFDFSPEQRIALVVLPQAGKGKVVPLKPWHESARATISEFRKSKSDKVAVVLSNSLSEAQASLWGEALAAAVGAYHAKLPNYKSSTLKHFKMKALSFIGSPDCCQAASQSAKSEEPVVEANNLVRTLVYMPPNKLDCSEFVKTAKEIAKEQKLLFKFYGRTQLQKMEAGAFLAVSQARPESGAGIAKLTYKPQGEKPKDLKSIALVGKGIVFDTGGTNLKPSSGLRHMKGDMGGAALALALVRLAKEEEWPIEVSAYLAISDNQIGENAYHPDEVITSLSGKTIEIIHTDAEGRMVLADTITLACKDEPEVLIDFATLTGAAIGAIGSRYAAAFTNQDEWHHSIREAGVESGERVWTFPLDDDFGECLQSNIADIKQCRLSGGSDHIEAAFFLKSFLTKGMKWMHVDLAADRCEGGLGAIPTNFVGFGVRFVRKFLKKVEII